MLLTISTTHTPATDLGYLLVKHPDRVQSFATTGGTAYVFYPEATADRCTAALLLDVDPVELARPSKGQKSPDGFSLGRYVNDRPYAASSLLTVAMGRVFRSALKGASRDRADLVDTAIPLEIEVPALPCRGGADVVGRLFAPLGWTVDAVPVPLDPAFPDWGDSRYVRLRLTGTLRLAEALNHLYVLLPVLDDAKHYWVAEDEVDKLLRAGDGWLGGHPERELIARRYLAGRRSLAQSALERLQAADGVAEEADDGHPEEVERKKPLVTLRKEAVLAALAGSGASRVLDLGCGPGALLEDLLADRRYAEIVGADVSSVSLALAERRLRFDRMPDRQRARITLIQSALTYHDDRLKGFDAAVLMEVVEHVDEVRLPALERAVFGHAAPRTVIVTTPNVEYNVRYESLDGHRHDDHRFEWTRAEFAAWTARVCAAYGYTAELRPVGEDDPQVGSPTQLAIFHQDTTTALTGEAGA
ncbi:3' terminal RNA ribose 2'-O-methyltransferase Hen1 [Longispora fulva]|uniref:Small RNA 2'-O-methyltransferase n=1 Tax=Longispora fulva TaxID=619741 RepID=A0A8J7GQM2_9ACTN|nr:3' terminal RNA ribose 2'-O-methyltransferase Hen1 [Longispora fulva]MBG6141533.1 3' terminal RNA ribose 2'-O-methyltransferase Hen1 [Longispora fulva]GIG59316.1 3' terminal RNA ribose 2'-O-methyltransferase Hen1 [Longispora fulva]